MCNIYDRETCHQVDSSLIDDLGRFAFIWSFQIFPQFVYFVSLCSLKSFLHFNQAFDLRMCSLKTESPEVKELKKQIKDDGSVTLTWKAPDGFINENARYVVEYNGERYLLSMDQTKYTIKSGLKDKSFTVKVRIF